MHRIRKIAPIPGLVLLLSVFSHPGLFAAGVEVRHPEVPSPAGALQAGRLTQEAVARLELSRDQRTAIGAVIAEHHPELLSELIVLHDARSALRRWIRAPEAGEDAIRRSCRLVAAAELELALHSAVLIRELRAVLAPRQQVEVPALVDGLKTAMGAWYAGFRRSSAVTSEEAEQGMDPRR